MVRGNPGLRSWEASQRPCELLSVALLSCSFIFLISSIDLCYLSKYGAFKKSSLFKKCSGLELRALLSYLVGPTSKGERAAAWSQIGKHNIFFNQTSAVFPHIGHVLSPRVAVNLIIFHLGCHNSDFFPQPRMVQHCYYLLQVFCSCLRPRSYCTINTPNLLVPCFLPPHSCH